MLEEIKTAPASSDEPTVPSGTVPAPTDTKAPKVTIVKNSILSGRWADADDDVNYG